ncbi:MAG TPA: serine/threonine-protein kinase [Kofleriaceae bacterium]
MGDASSAGPTLVGRSVGNFRVESRLGGGGMGEVYLLRHKRLPNTLAALKVLRADRVALPDVKERFVQEALVAAAVGGDRVARPIDIGRFDNGAPYIIFELAPGQTLAQLLASHGPLSVATALRVAFRVADTMALVHARGIVHRDLKPSNLMIDGELDDPRVRLLDFGVARAPADLRLAHTVEHAIVGSPGYMSPEAAIGKPIDAKSDVFSLGATLFRCLTGAVPFPSTSSEGLAALLSEPAPTIASARAIELPEGLEALVASMLAKKGDERPAMAMVRDALGKLTDLKPSEIVTSPIPLSVSAEDVVASTITLGRSAGPAVDLAAIRDQLEGLCNERLPTAFSRRRRTLALVGVAIVVIGVVGWILVSRQAATDRCDEQAQRMSSVWNATARRSFEASRRDAPFVREDLVAMDELAGRWRAQRVAVCHANGDGAIRRATCLDRAFDEFVHIVEREVGKNRLPMPSLLACTDPHDVRVRALGYSVGSRTRVLGPHADQITFVQGRELRIASIDGSERVVGELEGDTVRAVAWPTERRIILYDDRDLRAYDPQTKTLAPWIAGVPGLLAISADGEHVLTHRKTELFVHRRGAPVSSIATLPETSELRRAGVAPDGQHVAVWTSTQGANYAVVLVNVATRHMTVEPYRAVLTLSGSLELVWFDAERLVLNAQLDSSAGEGLLIARVRDGRLREPIAPLLAAQRYTAISPHTVASGTLLANRHSSDQRLVHVRRNETVRIPHATQPRYLTGRTDDGRLLVVRDDDSGWVTPNGQYTRIGGPKDALATNGKRVLLADGTTLFEISERGERRAIASAAGEVVCGGDACAVVHKTATSAEYRVLRGDHLEAAKTVALTSRLTDGVAMSFDDRHLALLDRSEANMRILVVDLVSGGVEAWKVPPRDGECGLEARFLAWAPDGALHVTSLCHESASRLYRVDRDRDPVAVFSTTAWIAGVVFDREGEIFANLKQATFELLLIDGI